MKWDKITEIFAALSGFFLSLLGGWSMPLQVLVTFSVLDYITGLLVAFRGKSNKTERGGIDSKVSALGLIKKVGILIVIMVGTQLEMLIGLDNNAVSQAMMYMFIANEGISILENTALLGVIKIPFLIRILEQLKDPSNKIGQILIDKGILTEKQLSEALNEQNTTNIKYEKGDVDNG